MIAKRIVKRLFNLFGLEISYCSRNSFGGVKSLRTKRLSLYKTATGSYYLPVDACNDAVANAIKSNKIFEEEVVNLAAQYIKPGTTVLDVGCNFGQMSILYSNMVGENGNVHSFDADDWVYEIFKKNIAANHKENIIIPHFGAVHNVNDETLIFPEQDFCEFETYGSYGVDYNAKEGRKVKSITIDSIDIVKPVSFMKIDIQGGDLQAMQGAVNTIKKHRMPILFEYEYHFEERFKMCFQDYVDFVRSIDYRFARVISGHNFLILPQEDRSNV